MTKRLMCAIFNGTACRFLEKIFSRESKPKCVLNETEKRRHLMMVYTNAFHAYLTAITAGAAQIAQSHSVDYSNALPHACMTKHLKK